MPRVSVLTPIYNTNPAHLRQCIESILNQTFTDFEFLILNDSPENTELDKVVKSYDDARIKYIRNEQNIGISASRNKLIQMARGEYLAIFDHDDISVPTRLARQVEYLDTHPDIGVVSGWLKYFGVDNSIWKTSEHDTDIRIHMVQDCSIAHTAAMLRKNILVDNDIQYEEFYSPAEDYRLWARLMAVTKFIISRIYWCTIDGIRIIPVVHKTHDACVRGGQFQWNYKTNIPHIPAQCCILTN